MTKFLDVFRIGLLTDRFSKVLINKKIEEEVLRAEKTIKQAVEMPKKSENSRCDGLNSIQTGIEIENETLKETRSLLASLTVGKTRKHYKEKKIKLKEIVSQIRKLKTDIKI